MQTMLILICAFTVFSQVNTAPVITSTPVTSVKVEEQYIYNITKFDAENHKTTITVPIKPNNMMYSSEYSRLTWAPGPTEKGTYPVTIVIKDSIGDSTIQRFNLIVIGANNTPPSITSSPPFTAQVSKLYTYNVTTYDKERREVTLSLVRKPENMILVNNKITWTPDKTGDFYVRLVAKDIYNDSSTQDFKITVKETEVNTAPIIISLPPVDQVEALKEYVYYITTMDKENNDVFLNLQTKPEGMTLINKKISWIPVKEQYGLHTIKLIAKDFTGDSSVQNFTIIVTSPKTIVKTKIIPHKISSNNQRFIYLLNGQIFNSNNFNNLKVSNKMKKLIIK